MEEPTLMSPIRAKRLSVALLSLLDNLGEAITGCRSIGLRAPLPIETPILV